MNGRRCAFTEEKAYWLEAYSTAGGKASQIPTAMWIKRPKGQLAKCGKAASLRTAFPEDCGYAAEEMDGKTLDHVNDATVINGQATRVNTHPDPAGTGVQANTDPNEAPRVIDLSMISPKVQKAVVELVRRTGLVGAWQAAYDYANNKFSGLDLTFALAELDKASEVYKAALPSQIKPPESTLMPPLTTAEDALTKARETLNSARN